jgi:CRP/FNR family transcriptional regulator
MKSPSAAIGITKLEPSCMSCSLGQICLMEGLSAQEVKGLNRLVYARRTVKRGDSVYRAGDTFGAVYAIRSGCFKTNCALPGGREQVTGFHLPGEIVGMDGICADRYPCNAVALEDSDVCVIPLSRLEEIAREVPSLEHQFNKLMSREVVRDQHAMMLLGGMRAEARLAAFLLDCSERWAARGNSSSEFELRMTREEIGSFLGLKLETVSRLFSKFQRENLLLVQQRHVRIVDAPGLRGILGKTVSVAREVGAEQARPVMRTTP